MNTGKSFINLIANPYEAIKLLENPRKGDSSIFGERFLYSNEDIEKWCAENNAVIDKIFGIRTFFSFIQDNSVKYNYEWYNKMLELELKVSSISEFRNIAFFNHLLIRKSMSIQ